MNQAAEKRDWFERVDETVFGLEKALVTTAASVMTVTVTLDILHRLFLADGAGPGGVLFAETSPALGELVNLLLLFLAGWFFTRSVARTPSLRRCILTGLGWAAGFYVLKLVLLHLESAKVCMGIAVAVTAAFSWRAVRDGKWGRLLLLIPIGGAVSFGFSYVREGYIWSQELSLILLAWVAFLGGSMATRLHKHITVDALSKLVPAAYAGVARRIGLLVTAAFCVYVVGLSFEHVFGEFGDFSSGERRPSTGMPAWTITLPVLTSFGFMGIRFLASAFRPLPAVDSPGGVK